MNAGGKAAVGVGIAVIAAMLLGRKKGHAQTGISWGTALNGMDGDFSLFKPGGHRPVFNRDYRSPDTGELDYFGGKGMKVFRIQMRWELCQPSLYGPLDDYYMGQLDYLANNAAQRGLKIIPTPMQSYVGTSTNQITTGYFDFAQNEGYILGSPGCPYSAFTDYWQKMAQHYKGNKGIYGLALCNEPHDMSANGLSSTYNWMAAAQEAIDAIREVDMNVPIIVNGCDYGASYGWTSWNRSYILKDLVDPGNNLLYEAHCYLDQNGTGIYANDTNRTLTPNQRGPVYLKPFVDWLRANSKRGIIGEMGVPPNRGATPDQYWLDCFDAALDYIRSNEDVLLSFQYHAAGPGWVEMGIEQHDSYGNFIDTPQMDVMERYM
jgi:endoglucanase